MSAAITYGEFRDFLDQEDELAAAVLRDVSEFENQEWVTVFTDVPGEEGDSYRLACLLKAGAEAGALSQPSFDLLSDHGKPGFVGSPSGGVEYLQVGAEAVVPLVFHRYSSFGLPDAVELSEDFRLFWNLFEERDRARFVTADETGEIVSVAEWRNDRLVIRKRFLRRYQAARQLSLSLQFEVTRRGDAELGHLVDVSLEIADQRYRISYYGGSGLSQPRHNFTRMLGKRVLPPPPIESCDVWPYEKEREYTSFIIGADGEGDPVEHTSDPDELGNYFGKNPDAPHYLTPVFFERSVLDRYYRDTDRYRIEDGYLRASGAWGLRMDNALDDHVAVFLGDLGSDLPEREQVYWRSYNVHPERMSETAFRRSFLGQWADTSRIELRFLRSYADLNERWQAVFGWSLFSTLHAADSHVTDGLHVPTNSSFGQFDEQIIRLAKLTVDSLNESSIQAALEVPPAKGTKGIGKLELFVSQQGIDDLGLCGQMRRVQGARTRSGAHRKGSDFELAALLDGASSLPELFSKMLSDFVESFDQIVL